MRYLTIYTLLIICEIASANSNVDIIKKMEDIEAKLSGATCDQAVSLYEEMVASLKKYENIDDNNSQVPIYEDEMLSYLRISEIYLRQGRKDDSNRNMRLAVDACKKSKMRSCEEADLKSFIRKFDKNRPFSCG